MSDYLPVYDTVGSTATLERITVSGCSTDDKHYTRLLSETKLRESEYISCNQKGIRRINERGSSSKSQLTSRICTIFLSLIAISLLITTIAGVALACTAWKKSLEPCQTNSTECTISPSDGLTCQTVEQTLSLVVSKVC